MVKIWIGVFWAGADGDVPRPVAAPAPPLMVAPTAVLAVLILTLGVVAGPMYDLCVRAAEDLLDPTAYTSAVLRGGIG